LSARYLCGGRCATSTRPSRSITAATTERGGEGGATAEDRWTRRGAATSKGAVSSVLGPGFLLPAAMLEPLDPKRFKRVEVNALHLKASGTQIVGNRWRLVSRAGSGENGDCEFAAALRSLPSLQLSARGGVLGA
jgi:hypothetical protein